MAEHHHPVIDLQAYRIRRMSDPELAQSISDTADVLAGQPPDEAAVEHGYLDQLLAEFHTREHARTTRP
jgi:hypothetical protein